ncbi:MAG: PD40 domain-containing protein [Acidobacteriaceae bacterium]|nr:PD40 domain-containing protein [Acidobacteriaceae bacterium]
MVRSLLILGCLAFGTTWAQTVATCGGLSPAVSSPDSKRTASLETCTERRGRDNSTVLVIETRAHQPARFSLTFRSVLGMSCAPQNGIAWLNNEDVAVTCDYQTLLSNFVIVNAGTGAIEHQYGGMWFRPSPDGKIIARVGVAQRYATPAGMRCCLTFNDNVVYPAGCTFEGIGSESRGKQKNFLGDEYTGIHTFLSEPVWSPDGRAVVFVEKVFDFHYDDPYNRDFNGRISSLEYYLAIVGRDGAVRGYRVPSAKRSNSLTWLGTTGIRMNGHSFTFSAQAPETIP